MIKFDKGNLQIRGSLVEIEAETVLILNKVRKDILIPVMGSEKAEEVMNRIIELSKKSNEEIREEAKTSAHEIFEDIFKGIFGEK